MENIKTVLAEKYGDLFRKDWFHMYNLSIQGYDCLKCVFKYCTQIFEQLDVESKSSIIINGKEFSYASCWDLISKEVTYLLNSETCVEIYESKLKEEQDIVSFLEIFKSFARFRRLAGYLDDSVSNAFRAFVLRYKSTGSIDCEQLESEYSKEELKEAMDRCGGIFGA